ncbi:IS4 family transposase [Archangium violaceum]|nr:IS4 family transposase [Archangium violaceum]
MRARPDRGGTQSPVHERGRTGGQPRLPGLLRADGVGGADGRRRLWSAGSVHLGAPGRAKGQGQEQKAAALRAEGERLVVAGPGGGRRARGRARAAAAHHRRRRRHFRVALPRDRRGLSTAGARRPGQASGGGRGKLWATLEGLPVVGSRPLHVSAQPARADRVARTARDATLLLRYAPLTLLPPGRQGGQPVRVWGVLVREEAPPQGQKAVEWLLLSNAPIESEEAAWGAVTAYQKRWGIEELHKALKTGCRLEGRQHEAREHLENLLALTLLTSVKLLRLRTLSRTLPDEPADAVLAPAEVQVLQAMAPQLSPRMPLQGALTLRQALLLIAALGGYMANPQKRPPGWLVLWRGYERLRDYVAGFSLAQFLSAAPPPA